MDMKKLLAAISIVILIGVYIFYRMSSATPTPAATTGTLTGNPDIGNINPNASSTGSTPPPTPAPASAYKDGSYTGSVTDAFYGKVQVKAIIKNGVITDVVFLQYPNDAEHSVEVSNHVIPLLTAEAIKVQSANVDTISGATQTSEAFQQSLGSALVQAKA